MLWIFLEGFIRVAANHMLETLLKALTLPISTRKYLTFPSAVTLNGEYRICDLQLEGHPLTSNRELINFNVRSNNIVWKKLIVPLQPRTFRSVRYLGSDFNLMSNTYATGLISNGSRREVLVCHDMMGNYLEDRHYSRSKKWDDYRFYHWAGIDYFCYFSHNYITIPPCGWINAGHLHGVKVLGTFITEGSLGSQLLLGVLESRSKIDQICEAMIRLCDHFCFEGWLINIECNVPTDKLDDLVYFLDTLRANIIKKIPNGTVFWYDSVINNGAVSWQNEINEKNIRFFNSTDATLVNYTWNQTNLSNTARKLHADQQPLKKAFFGIDIFARGQIAKFKTNQTLARLGNNFSIGLFAPAWTFESLQNFGYKINVLTGSEDVNEAFLSRNDRFWWLLWKYFVTHAYTNLPFYSSFCLGSGKLRFSYGQPVDGKFFNLCRQNIQPSVPLCGYAERCFDDAVNGGSSLRIIKYDLSFRLFATDLVADKALIFAYAFKMDNSAAGQLDLLLRLCENDNQKDCYLMCGDYNNTIQLEKGRCYLSPIAKEHYPIISRIMQREKAQMLLPFDLNNGWTVRYYGVSLDRSVFVRDIGVLFRKNDHIIGGANNTTTALLGAVYFNSFSMTISNHDIPNWIQFNNQSLLSD